MTSEEVRTLDLIRSKLVDNYRGRIKGTQPMIASSMAVAYGQGAENMLREILTQFDLTAKGPEGEAA